MNSKARTFFYMSAGILCLAMAYHLGARNAGAQVNSMVSGFASSGLAGDGGAVYAPTVMTPNGDVYGRVQLGPSGSTPLIYLGNFWGGGPVPTAPATFGQVKARWDSRTTPQQGEGAKRIMNDGR